MKKLFSIMAILIMVLGASITCVAAEPAGVQTVGTEVAVDQANQTIVVAQNDAERGVANSTKETSSSKHSRKEVKKESWPIGAKIGVSVVVGCLISLIIIMGMIRGMNTAREATQAENYYDSDSVRIAVKSDRYTHSKKSVTRKQ